MPPEQRYWAHPMQKSQRLGDGISSTDGLRDGFGVTQYTALAF